MYDANTEVHLKPSSFLLVCAANFRDQLEHFHQIYAKLLRQILNKINEICLRNFLKQRSHPKNLNVVIISSNRDGFPFLWYLEEYFSLFIFHIMKVAEKCSKKAIN